MLSGVYQMFASMLEGANRKEGESREEWIEGSLKVARGCIVAAGGFCFGMWMLVKESEK